MGQMSNSKEWESQKESIKKFIKGRWFPLIIGIAIAILAGGIMAFFGWRITYIPELENSWDAISATATWVGVIMSFLAIVFAIWVPIVIAKRQDKIALFEKRFECYMAIQRLLAFAVSIKDFDTSEEICKAFIVSMGYPARNFKNSDISEVIGCFQKLESSIIAGVFLFKTFQIKEIQEIIKATIDLVFPLTQKFSQGTVEALSVQQKETRDKIYSSGINFKSCHLDKIEQDMKNC